ncbi:desiccation-related protein PCC13-62-like [Nicotiana sylvestris]|uniref:Desiccation-related protein PCC13-62-like n=1 Tax=Nicotiana sylvestris TaxID=4096 RepID=A0A1U7Y3S9_NICSY|nr:PREDICTED: desiccation-related protein PCC13-62-like [Nicotiana sylvestris]
MRLAQFSALFFLLLQLPSLTYCIEAANHEFFMDCDNNANYHVGKPDVDLLEFPLNLEYLEAEFFLWAAFGRGLDSFSPDLAAGGPPPIGARIAKLSPLIKDVIAQFGFQEVGHLRAIKKTIAGFPRPLLNLTAESFGTIMNDAFGHTLEPPFNPYANDINFLLASYVVPYVGLTGYVGANPKLKSPTAKKLAAGLLGVESGQDAVLRTLLYQRAIEKVEPYGIPVAEFTSQISKLRNKLGHQGLKDEGLIVKPKEGAEGKIKGNVLAGNKHSLAYGRTPEEILRIVYGTGKENKSGGFFPKGGDGRIAKSHLGKIKKSEG